MTSQQKGEGASRNAPKIADKQYRFCGQREVRGSKKSQNYVDVIDGSPLTSKSLSVSSSFMTSSGEYCLAGVANRPRRMGSTPPSWTRRQGLHGSNSMLVAHHVVIS